MTYGDEDIERQLRLGEDSHWEFKEIEFAGNHPRSPSRNDWADEIAAFANANGGVLLCGVTDKGEVQGTDAVSGYVCSGRWAYWSRRDRKR